MEYTDNMDTRTTNEEEVSTWVIDNKKKCMQAFFDHFRDIYDKFLMEVVKCKKIEEYINLEKLIIESTAASKPGKIPIRLNKPETKVPAVYYFLSLFLIKFAGVQVDNILEGILCRVQTAAAQHKRIEKRYSDLQQKFDDLEKNVENSVDAALTNGLVIQDLENKIRNLEADLIAKERIILEKSEANNILWGKIKALEEKEENLTSQVPKMEIDNEKQIKKNTPTKREKGREYNKLKMGRSTDNVGFVEYMRSKKCYKYKTVRVTLRFSNEYEKIYKEGGVNVSLTRNGRQYFIRMFDSRLSYREIKEKFHWQAVKRLEVDAPKDDEMNLMNAINESIRINDLGQGLWIKKPSDYIDENGELQELNKRSEYERDASRPNSFRREWEQQSSPSTHFAPSRRQNQWR
ncbi:hypothetical protein RhiirA5_420499 [Rhizophagus irregularis]|uniref:Uncharacterized protein n=1 Tax=Rhizophagus irregularis TaxID=588596 RepID=A0A2N0PG04_9GLOM|nr:hypothetical protein RhiirA5_420499 [Rhizophagus irregularis]